MSYMRNIKVWGLALSAMLLISGLAVANASAHQWTDNGAAIPVGTSVATIGHGTLTITDTNGFFGSTVSIECTGDTTGTVGPGAADTTSTVTVTECKTDVGTCGSPSASAIHLPWKTELSTVGSPAILRDTIRADGAGAPGYKVKCTIFGSTITDECSSERGQPKVTSMTVPVNLEFDAGSGTADCTLGGKEAGHVRKSVDVTAAKAGHSITISNP